MVEWKISTTRNNNRTFLFRYNSSLRDSCEIRYFAGEFHMNPSTIDLLQTKGEKQWFFRSTILPHFSCRYGCCHALAEITSNILHNQHFSIFPSKRQLSIWESWVFLKFIGESKINFSTLNLIICRPFPFCQLITFALMNTLCNDALTRLLERDSHSGWLSIRA